MVDNGELFTYHIFNDTSSLSDTTALESRMNHVLDQLSSRNVTALEAIKVDPADLMGALRNGL